MKITELVMALIIVVLIALISYGFGGNSVRKEAARRGFAEYSINKDTGRIEFGWISPVWKNTTTTIIE